MLKFAAMNERITDIITWSRRYIRLSFVVVVAVLAYLLFFSDNSVLDNYRYQQEIDLLRAEISDNTDTLFYYQDLNRRLQTDPETMERIVREQYHMQRPGEDVYVIK